jgi:IclR family KDG regulon transcriptional repressor
MSEANQQAMAGHRTTSRVLDIIETVAQSENGLTFSAIVQALGMPKSSLHPLLHTLSTRNYLYFNKKLQRYFMGEKLFGLGNRYIGTVDVLKAIQDEVNKFSDQVGETVYFGVRRGKDVLYLAKGEPNIPIRIVTASTGHRLSANATGLGKALLADFSLQQLRELYPNGLELLTPRTIASFEELHRQLAEVRASGFAYEEEESTSGIQCIASPIRLNGRIVAAMSVSIPVFRFSGEMSARVKSCLTNWTERISKLICMNYENWSRLYPEE